MLLFKPVTIATDWKPYRKWEQSLNLDLSSWLNATLEVRKIAVLLHCIGEDALEIYNTLDWTGLTVHEDPEDRKLEEDSF